MYSKTASIPESSAVSRSRFVDRLPIHQVAAWSVGLSLVALVSIVLFLDFGLRGLEHHSQMSVQFTEQNVAAIDTMDAVVEPVQAFQVATSRFLHHFELIQLDRTLAAEPLIDAARNLRTVVDQLPWERMQTSGLFKAINTEPANLRETVGVVSLIAEDVIYSEDRNQLGNVLYDSSSYLPEIEALAAKFQQLNQFSIKNSIAHVLESVSQARMHVAHQQAVSHKLRVIIVSVVALLGAMLVISTLFVYRHASQRISIVRSYTARIHAGNYDAVLGLDEGDVVGKLGADVQSMGQRLANEIVTAEQAQKLTQQQAWVDERINGLGLQLSSAPNALELADGLFQSLQSSIGVVAAQLYAVEDSQCDWLASYGVDNTNDQVTVAVPALVREVALSGSAKSLSESRTVTLPVRSGLLHGSPTVIEILPVLHQKNTIAVLELGLLAVLSEREQDYLLQALDLFSLHLLASYQRERVEKALEVAGETARQLEMQAQELEDAKLRAEQASHFKSEFLANMSHEIRTPLNGIIGNADLLALGNIDAREKSICKTVQRSGKVLLSLVNDILDFSKIEAGKLEIENVDFDLRVLLEDTLEMHAEPAHSKGLELLTRLPATREIEVTGDPTRLSQVLINLIGNAIKFTSEGEVTVTVEQRDDYTCFEVRDTGVGIEPGAENYIFEAFSQQDGSTTRKFGGTGLGLAVSRQLVELMGGEIGCRRRRNGGSVFWFTVRLPWTSEQLAPRTLPPHLQSAVVLVVEASAVARDIFSQELQSLCIKHQVFESVELFESALMIPDQWADTQGTVLISSNVSIERAKHAALAVRAQGDVAQWPVTIMATSHDELDYAWMNEHDIGSVFKPLRQRHLQNLIQNSLGQASESSVDDRVNSSEPLGLKILAVDDSSMNRKLLKDLLKVFGCDCTLASDGYAALQHAGTTKYDIVLLDCQMPGIDGYETAQRLRSQHAASYHSTPIAALTANAMAGDRQRCLDAGMSHYLSKPFRAEELYKLLCDACPEAIAAFAKNTRASDQSAAAPSGQAEHQPVAVVETAEVISFNPINSAEDAIDVDALNVLRRMGGGGLPGDAFVVEYLTLYLTESEGLINRIQKASESGDSSALELAAHSLKSDSAYVGAKQLSSMCERIEMAARSKNETEVSNDLANLESVYRKSRAVLEVRLGRVA